MLRHTKNFLKIGWFETFEQYYTTPGGDEVVAFGYYGRN